MTIERLFFTSLAVSILLFVSFFLFNPKPSNQTFKKAGTREAAAEILVKWGPEGLKTARRNLAVDVLFILAYSTMWITGALYFGARANLPFPAMLIAVTGIAGALCDIVENVCLYKMLYGNTAEWAPRLCKRVFPLNAGFFILTGLLLLIAFLWTRQRTV